MKSGPVAIGRLFSDLAASFAAVLERKRAEIRCDVEGVESFVADRKKMKQQLLNLVDNSLTFCDEACVVALIARREGREMEISVSDNGWGISGEDLPHLTERFYRGKRWAWVRGTGLGLLICSEVLKMHGGKMEITSKTGSGTRVIVTLPLRKSGAMKNGCGGIYGLKREEMPPMARNLAVDDTFDAMTSARPDRKMES
jgi:signal transduction histidine kinase